MAGQISRYTGPTVPPSWFDMADSAAQQQALDARDKVVATLAQGDPSPPSGATATPPAPLFGPIATRSPAPNRSGQRLGKSKVASAAEAAKVAKLGQIISSLIAADQASRIIQQNEDGQNGY